MKVQGSVSPEAIYVQYIDKDANSAHIRLRNNITNVTTHDDISNTDTTLYSYDEIIFEFQLTDIIQAEADIIAKITPDFTTYFNFYLDIENEKILELQKQSEIDDLINNKKLLDYKDMIVEIFKSTII